MGKPAEVEFVVLDDAVPRPSFEDLYADQFLPMVRLATLMCGRTEVARDIVQDSFVKLHLKWVGVEHPKAYLRRSVVNGCRSQARWERRRRGRPTESEPSVEQPPDELFDVLASLPHRQRAAIVLKYYEQRTEAEIAEILGCRPGTVGSLVSRGLTSMRGVLTPEAQTPEAQAPEGGTP
jgi:RNA polymerase sigma factor (sigma-70 family)